MDRERFDALTRLVSASGSRRHALAILAGGLLLHHDAASLLAGPRKRTSKGNGKRKRQRRPDEAVICHNGEQFLVPREAVRGVLLNGGTLGPCPSDTPLGSGEGLCKSAGDCRDRTCHQANCLNGVCVYTPVANGRSGPGCSGTNQCWDETCLSPPTCLGVNERTDRLCSRCCSNGCGRADTESSDFFCFVGVEGDRCHDDNDCSIPVGKCVAFRCT
jgi:hypothetical protein